MWQYFAAEAGRRILDSMDRGAPSARASGAYGSQGDYRFGLTKTPSDVDVIGGEYAKFLSDALSGGTAESDRFKRMSTVLRDNADKMRFTARADATNRANTRGYMDSGEMSDIFAGIDRSTAESYTQGIQQLLFALEESALGKVFPWLAGASQEALGLQGININADLTRRGQNMNFITDLMRYGQGNQSSPPTSGKPQ